MKEHEEASEEDFDKCGIVRSDDSTMKKCKDDLVIYRRRSCILTNKTLVHKEVMKREEKTLAATIAEDKKLERKRKAAEKAALKTNPLQVPKKARSK
jgi:hypothetical protein